MSSLNDLSSQPRLCFIGPMLGVNPGWVTSQGEVLAGLLAAEGYCVLRTSSYPNRLLRLTDSIYKIAHWRNDFDVAILLVFSNLAFVYVDIMSKFVNILGKPLILWLHGGNLPEFSKRRSRWFKRVIMRGDLVVSPTEYLVADQPDLNRVTIIPNVINIEKYPNKSREHLAPKLLWMRTFHEIYNPLMALDVLTNLLPQYPDASLTMAGQDTGMLAAVKQETTRRNLSPQVRFPGFLDSSAKLVEFANHDIFLNTNHVDNMPVSVIEAAAFGLPVVSTSVGGIPYMLQDECNALLVEDGCTDQMTAAIVRLLDSPELALNLSKNGRQLADSCSWPHVKSAWKQAFDQVF